MRKWMMGMGLVGALLIWGCDRQPAPTATEQQATAGALPANLIATAAPAGEAQDVGAARQAVKDGDHVVVRGKVAGSVDPIAANRAIMTILDPAIVTCDQMSGDHCKTPWDACCEPSENLAANTATVQVLGEDGKPVRSTLKGVGGISPLKQVVVAGTAKIPPGSQTLVIDANQIYVQP